MRFSHMKSRPESDRKDEDDRVNQEKKRMNPLFARGAMVGVNEFIFRHEKG